LLEEKDFESDGKSFQFRRLCRRRAGNMEEKTRVFSRSPPAPGEEEEAKFDGKNLFLKTEVN